MSVLKNTEIYYPETDGEPTGETDTHIELITNLRVSLRNFFRDREDVYVGSNLLLYYVEGNPNRFLVPDVFVARGVGKLPPRRTYKIWEEGHAPDVVIEISSGSTWHKDLQEKWLLYQQIGVREYFIFDPEYEYLKQPLFGYRLQQGQYERVEVIEGRVRSEGLGLELVDTGETLRLWDPLTGQFLMTPMEEAEAHRIEAEARQHAEEALQTEAEARKRAEAELARLREEIGRLRKSE